MGVGTQSRAWCRVGEYLWNKSTSALKTTETAKHVGWSKFSFSVPNKEMATPYPLLFILLSLVFTVLELTCALEQVSEQLFIRQVFNSNSFNTQVGCHQHRFSEISFLCLNVLEFGDGSQQLDQTLPNVSFPFSFPKASSLADLTIPVISLVNSLSIQCSVLVLPTSCLIRLQGMEYC